MLRHVLARAAQPRGLVAGAVVCGGGGGAAVVVAAPAADSAPASPAAGGSADKDARGPLATRDGPQKYVVYARRVAQALLAKGRFVAYSSDVGESVRPVVPPWVVRICYGLTWGYVAVDVAFNADGARSRGAPTMDVVRTATQAFTFQTIASVLVPSLIIHQAVHAAQRAVRTFPPNLLVRWAPTLVGLAIIPALPLIDEPIEHAIDAGFDAAWPREGEQQSAKPKKD